jgi:hypothetical protein
VSFVSLWFVPLDRQRDCILGYILPTKPRRATVIALQQQGYDTLRVTEILPATATDREILDFARLENRIVLTQDFGRTAFCQVLFTNCNLLSNKS